MFTLKHASFEHCIHTLVHMHSVLKGICVNMCIRWEGLWRGSRGELKDSNLLFLVSEPITWLTCYICMWSLSIIIAELIWNTWYYWYWLLWMIWIRDASEFIFDTTEVLMVICWTQYMSYWKWYWVYVLHLISYGLKGMVWPMCSGMCNSIESIDYTRK